MEDKIKIVIVEDHILLARLMNNKLKAEANYEVVGLLTNMNEILINLNQNNVDIILLDLILPDIDGLSILKRVKELYPSIKVIIITMIEEPEVIYKAVKMGTNGYLTKHSDFEEVKNAINCVMMNDSYFCKRSMNLFIKAMNEINKAELTNIHSTNNNEMKEFIELHRKDNYYYGTSSNNKYSKIEKSEYLSKREKQILNYIIQGYNTPKELSEKLLISYRTAETHRKHVLKKLGVKNIAGLMQRIYNNTSLPIRL
jgi:DNA-binding NarL/FixJ family response regulator